jgi:formylglycine-generating enzyme required for sulfatase activity
MGRLSSRIVYAFLVLTLIGLLLPGCTILGLEESFPAPTQPPPSTPTADPTTAVIPPQEESPTPEPSPMPSLTPTFESTPTLEPTPQNLCTAESDGMEQILIPAGEFLLGGADLEAQQTFGNGVAYPEVPQHSVSLAEYWIDKFEVSNRQYALCVSAGACTPPKWNVSFTRNSYYDNPEFANYPVIFVSWWQAGEYCAWAGRRLPSEAEWEKAARGTDGRLYPWGNEPVSSDRANLCDGNCPKTHANINFDDGYPDTAPVDAFPNGASPYGVMNMSGNVWEWTSTLTAPYPYDPADGRENPDTYDHRIWRGGSWANGPWYLRSSTRYHSVQKYQYFNVGFRCAATP